MKLALDPWMIRDRSFATSQAEANDYHSLRDCCATPKNA